MTDARPPRYVLPFPPRGMRRVEAAAYIGVSPSLFDRMIDDGVMPKPKRYRGRVMWDRLAIEEAFAALPEKDGGPPVSNPWDRMSNDPAPNPWDAVSNKSGRRSLWDDMSRDPKTPAKPRGRPKKA